MRRETIVMAMVLMEAIAPAAAQSSEDVLIKQSFLAVSAFQCSVLAVDPKQKERLFMLGYKAGQEFVETAKAKPALYAKVRAEIPMLWALTGGPTTDFILGQVYAQLHADIYKKFESDEKLWKLVKDNMFREKNCALI